jgi:hypothetical protein
MHAHFASIEVLVSFDHACMPGLAGEEADFGLFLNGTVIDLSSTLLEAE